MRRVVPNVLTESHRLQLQLCRERPDAAQTRYEAAAEELRQAVEGGGNGGAWQEILEIRFHQADALSEYLDALRTFVEITEARPF
jgi:hypothetical protein